MQRLGQHFLKNRSAAEKTVRVLELSRGDIILEIGPGHGELTKELLGAVKGLKIVAVEKDGELAANLRNDLLNAGEDSVEIITGDILTLLDSKTTGYKSYKLTGNIPYYITGHLLRAVGELNNKPERAVFMIQKEVAERIVAKPPKMNRLAASVQFWSEPLIISTVSKENFFPEPKVDSAIILLKTKLAIPPVDPNCYYEALRALFAQPRKTILNNLVSVRGDKVAVSAALQKIYIDPGFRPQNLAVKEIAAIAQAFFCG